MSQHVLNASPRTISNKGAVKALRRDGKIPAVVYNRHGKTANIVLDAREFAKSTVGVTESTIIELKVADESYQCMIKQRQLDWLREKVVHVDFFEIERGIVMKAKVQIHLLGNPIGVREGGILETPIHDVEVECLPKDMPAKFEIDVTNLKANHTLYVKDIDCPSEVKILASPDQAIAIVKFARGETATDEAEETEEAAATDEEGEKKE